MTEIDERLAWELPLLEEVFCKSHPGPLLDLGSGPGRVAIPLARQGYIVRGVDIVPEFVATGNEAAQRERLDCQLFRRDFLAVDASLGTFAGVFSMWGSFRHVVFPEEQTEVFSLVRQRVEGGGLVLIDTIDEDRVTRAPNVKNRYQHREKSVVPGCVRVFHEESGSHTDAYCFTERLLGDRMRDAGLRDVHRLEVQTEPSRLVMVGTA